MERSGFLKSELKDGCMSILPMLSGLSHGMPKIDVILMFGFIFFPSILKDGPIRGLS